MFSGIIDAVGRIHAVRTTDRGAVLTVRAAGYWSGVSVGASVAVDGVCLTVTHVDGNDAAFDVIPETLRRSTLGSLKPNDAVNLQKALAVGDRIDGHFVQGHVDAVARVSRVEHTTRESILWLSPPAEAMDYLIPKGSVAVDGVSLTIAALSGDSFSVALIPTTLQRTTLGRKRPGDRVNIETDLLARTVVHHLQFLCKNGDASTPGVTRQRLRDAGFLS